MEPDVQAKLHAEIIAALNNPELGKTREDRVEAYVVKTDTYLHYCNQESGRLRPVLCKLYLLLENLGLDLSHL